MDLKLPLGVSTKKDLMMLSRELSTFSNQVYQSIMHHEKPIKYPPISDNLRQFIVLNQVDFKNPRKCQQAITSLGEFKKYAPIVHISFAQNPPIDVIQKITAWFRSQVDPNCLITIGLQPSIAAGIILKTTNKQFDFSIRQRLESEKEKLKESLSV